MKKNSNFSLAVALASASVLFGAIEALAGWANGKDGIVHVPIATLQTKTQLSPDLEISHFDVEGPIPPAELAELKKHEPFKGKSDAEILAKMNIIRRNVVRAIDATLTEDPELHYCLVRAFFGRRLCLEFSSRAISGIANANRFSKKDACELGGIAIKNVPCDLRPVYDADMLGLMSTLMHETLHLGQDWPPLWMPIRIQPNTTDIGQRIHFQQNEIAASKAEKKRLENLFQVFSWMGYNNGELPPDDERQGFKKLPLTLAIVKQFKKDVPSAEQAEKAKEISGRLASILVSQVCLTLKCREAVKAALDQLLIDVRENPDDFRAAASRFRKAIRGSRDASGWFRQLGNATFNGLFKTDIAAGGLEGDTNTVRQYFGTDSASVSIPLDFITDAIVLDNGSLLVAGANEGAESGTIFEFNDTDGDGFVEQETMSVRLTHMYLATSNSFCRGGDGDLYLLNRDSLMFFRLDESMPTISIQYQGTIGDPELDDINHIAVSNDGLGVVGYSYADSALCPSLGWVKATRESKGDFFGGAVGYSWLEESFFTPNITVWPHAGDMNITATGAPGGAYSIGAYFGPTMQTISTGNFDQEGRVTVPLMFPTNAGDRWIIGTPGLGSESFPVQVPGPYDLSRTQVSMPTAEQLGLPGTRSDYKIGVTSCPGATVWSMTLDLKGIEESAGSGQLDGYGRNYFAFDVEYGAELKWQEFSQFKIRLSGSTLEINDETHCVPPGVKSIIDVADNDTFPAGTMFSLTGQAPLHHDIFQFGSDGKVELAPLTTVSEFTVSYKATAPDGTSASGTATIQVDRSKLCTGPMAVAEGPDGQLVIGVRVPCILLGKEDEWKAFPMYQFNLGNSPNDECEQPHWHSSGRVFSLLEQGGVIDPDPPECGFGEWSKIEQNTVVVPAAEWESFKSRHPL